VRKIIFVVPVAVAAVLFLQCGTPSSKCNPTNCPNGCCDSAQNCVAGTSTSACGKSGTICGVCSSGQSCSANTCVGGNGGSGGGSGGSGGGTHTGGGTGGSGGGSATGGGSGGSGGGTGGTGGSGGGTAQSCNFMAANPMCPTNTECLINNENTFSAKCYPGCDLITQNCPTGTDKCSYTINGTTATRSCIPEGTKTEGQTCGPNTDDCAKGLLCSGPQGGPTVCTKYCSPFISGSCPSGKNCSGGSHVPGLEEIPLLCAPNCDLLAQNCAGTNNCIPIPPAAGGGATCVPGGSAGPGGACPNVVECAKGNACFNTGTNSCFKLCNLDGGSPACGNDGGTCTDEGIGEQNAGICE
jgi:hypothetical protein